MTTIDFTQKNGKTIKVNEEDLLRNMIEYLRREFADSECVVYEINETAEGTEEGPAAVFFLLKNPHLVKHYNRVVETNNKPNK